MPRLLHESPDRSEGWEVKPMIYSEKLPDEIWMWTVLWLSRSFGNWHSFRAKDFGTVLCYLEGAYRRGDVIRRTA